MFVEALTARDQDLTGKVGIHLSRYGLVAALLLIGVLKFTAGEAQGIQPLVASSPLMFWLYRFSAFSSFPILSERSKSLSLHS